MTQNRQSSGTFGKICLIRPPAVEAFRFSTGSITLPLGLAYIAASLEKSDFEVNVIDAIAGGPRTHTRYVKGYLVGLRFADIIARIPQGTHVVGITAVFTHEWPAIARLVSLIKKARPELAVVVGGEHVSAMAEFCLSTCPVDFACLGEGEETIVELSKAIVSRDRIDDIAGIAYRKGGKIVVNPRRARQRDVDSIPWPAWHLFDIHTYFKHDYVGGTNVGEVTMPILATRGCPYQCTFCAAPNMWTPSWMPRDPVKVADEMEYYYRTYGAQNFPFQDLTAIVRKEWIIKFCDEIIRRKLPISWQFPSGTRSEAIDDGVAALLKKSNMINIAYAPESGSERTRKLIKKKMETETLVESVQCSIRQGLRVSLFYVLGFPHDTVEDMRENLRFLKRARSLGVKDLPVGLFMALPGTQLFETLFEKGKVRLDPGYFAHILQGSLIMPMRSYCEKLSIYALGYWKLRLSLEFYLRKAGGPADTHEEAEKGSRLQTALFNGLKSMVAVVAAQLSPRWMTKKEEIEMIKPWHDLYCEIRRAKKDTGVVKSLPPEEEQLYATNVIEKVRHDHSHRVEIADALV